MIYENPPLVEAVCEFTFKDPADSTVPGLFFGVQRKDFPRKDEVDQYRLMPGENGEPNPERVVNTQFWNEAGSIVIQICGNLLTVNALKPYPGWDEYKTLVLNNLEVYSKVAALPGVSQVSLRYINLLKIPKTPDVELVLSEYLRAYSVFPLELRETPRQGFYSRVDLPCALGVLTIITTPSGASDENLLSVMLDIAVNSSGNGQDQSDSDPKQMTRLEVSNWIQAAHEKIETAFLTCVTSKAKLLFVKDKDEINEPN